MKPDRLLLVKRMVVLVGFASMVAGIAAFDWRVGLVVAGASLTGSALDIRWGRRP